MPVIHIHLAPLYTVTIAHAASDRKFVVACPAIIAQKFNLIIGSKSFSS